MCDGGAQRISVLAYGKTTHLTMEGDWASPSFDGSFLPHFIDTMQFWYDRGVHLFKFDFANFTIATPDAARRFTKEEIVRRNCDALREALLEFKKRNPEVLLAAFNGFGGDTRVPFWPINAAQYEGVYRADARLTKRLPISERVKLDLNFEAFNITNTPRDTSINHQAYIATNGVLAPSAGYGSGVASAGVSPEGTNVRRAQVSLRLVF
jgi:hypothetical protein